jgi:predicted nucleotidyltransferase
MNSLSLEYTVSNRSFLFIFAKRISEAKMLHPLLKDRLPEIIELFKKHYIKSAYAFGSAVTDKYSEQSDVDFIINFQEGLDPLLAGEHWWGLHDELRELLNREIDLVTERSLKNPYFIKQLKETRVAIYG